ncbi:hypothetical protein [Salmonella enterica]|nr:hypothetical protein [Salmonella enterica]
MVITLPPASSPTSQHRRRFRLFFTEERPDILVEEAAGLWA